MYTYIHLIILAKGIINFYKPLILESSQVRAFAAHNQQPTHTQSNTLREGEGADSPISSYTVVRQHMHWGGGGGRLTDTSEADVEQQC